MFRLNAPVVIRAKVESKQAIFRLKLVKDKPLNLYLLLTTIKGQMSLNCLTYFDEHRHSIHTYVQIG